MLQRYNHVMKLAILNTWYFPLVIKNRKAAMNKLISQRKQKKKTAPQVPDMKHVNYQLVIITSTVSHSQAAVKYHSMSQVVFVWRPAHKMSLGTIPLGSVNHVCVTSLE